jgi:hypothetical protein
MSNPHSCAEWRTIGLIPPTPSIRGETLNDMGGGYMNDFYAREFWRFVLVQQKVAELAQTAIQLSADAGAGFVQS